MSIFKTSINIKYDIGKKEFYNRYIPTSAHSDILNGIINGINAEGNRSHIAIGPYGTGKSLITTLIAGIVSQRIDEKTFNILINKFSNSDENIVIKLNELKRHKKLLPVIINGAEGDFEEVLISRIFSVLNENKIRITSTSIHNDIVKTIESWKSNYKLLYSNFISLLINTNQNIDNFVYLVSQEDEKAIEWFLNTYTSLTGGNSFSSIGDKSFMTAIEEIVDQLEKVNLGLFIIYDEFGRYLQTLPENRIGKTMGILQDLAEFIDHKSKFSHLLLITHKHLSSYFSRESDELKSEFNRIEKRFTIYTIRNDQETFFDIANEIIKSYNISDINDDYIFKQESMLRKYSLFEYNQTVIENKIIKGCYPIHPVSIYLLSKLSALYGQNERTLFTFLESIETGGLLNHINNENGLYLSYKLFDYFFTNLSVDENPFYIKKYIKLEREINDNNENKQTLLNILKFITLWEETKSNTVQKLTTEFLNYVFEEDIKLYIEELSYLKLLRFNRISNKWELFEGSTVDINKKIEETKKCLILNNLNKIDKLNDIFIHKHYFSEEYNHIRSMTRFSRNILITAEQFMDDSYKINNEDADLHVYYILNSSNIDEDTIKAKIYEINDELMIFCITDLTLEQFNKFIVDWFCLDTLLKDKKFYNQDINLKEELYVEIKDIEYEILLLLNKIFNFNSKYYWYNNKNDISKFIVSEKSLSDYLSKVFSRVYKFTPEIKNEMFNRKNISNQQLNAAKKLINNIIKNPLSEDFGIEGTGPDYLIYATVFKNKAFLPNKDISESNDEGLKELYNRVNNTIEIKKRSQFKDLINIFLDSPFGIRKPTIPVLLVGILKNKWNYMMFFSKGSFIPNVTADTLYEMMKNPEDYEYTVFQYDETYTDFFEAMNHIFEESREALLEYKPLHIKVAATMLRWLQSLPKICQTTEQLEKSELDFRQSIKSIEIDPYKVFRKLRINFENDRYDIILKKLKLEQYFVEYQVYLGKRINDIITIVDIKEWVKINKIEHSNNLLLLEIENCNYQLEITYLSEALIGVSLNDWTEVTETIFFNEVDKQLKDINIVEFNPDKHIKISVGDEISIIHKSIELTTKAKLIETNINRIIGTQGKFISKEELDYLIYKLINKFLK